jgi:two-component system, sensor histidine kinase ChiS
MSDNALQPEIAKRKITSFAVIQIVSLISVTVFLCLPFIFGGYFSWISSKKVYAISAFILLVYQFVVFIMSTIFKKNIFWKTSGFVWSIGYFIFVLITGGVNSSYIFLPLFIPVISLFEFDSRITRDVSVFMVFLLSLVIFFEPHLNDVSLWTKHILNIFGIGMISFLIYKFAKGTIKEKNDKEQLQRRFLELNEIDHTKQVFLSAMSHQLRTPLNGVRWAFEAVLKTQKNNRGEFDSVDPVLIQEGYKRVLDSIEIIGKILKTAELEIDRKNIELKNEKVNLKNLLDSIFVNLDYLIREKMINLVKENYNDVEIDGDYKMLDLAITNVIDNSFRYSPKGNVVINLFAAKEQAVLIVADSGIGIDPAELEYIFQKFYRGKNAMIVDPDESGIGLYTTKKIIELHGGRITLSSVLGKGTKISIALPFGKKI